MEVPWNPKEGKAKKRSKPHQRCIDLLTKMFPACVIVNEVTIPGTRLRIDIWLPMYKTILEVDGIQHTTKSSFFHEHNCDFDQQKKNDKMKEEFARRNNLGFARLDDDEPDSLWQDKILKAIQ